MTVRTPHVALVLASSTGGIGRHVASLAAGLTRLGCEVAVYGPAATETHFDFTRCGARFTAVEMPTGDRPRDSARDLPPTPAGPRGSHTGTSTAVRALRRALLAAPPDVIHAHGLRAALVADLARRLPSGLARNPLARTPLVVTWHNTVLPGGLRGRVLRLAERRVARAADVTLGASADLVDRARELGARDARLGEIAAPPLVASGRGPEQLREELGVGPGQQMVLSVGRLHPQKAYHILIQAAARWRGRTPPPVVVIAGSGPAYLALATQASTARAPITLVGHRSDVADLLAAADVAVVTSVWEARQLFAQEALRAGVPLVATAVGGLPDLVGDAALLVAPDSVDEVDRAVTALLDDPSLRRDLAVRGQVRARQWPTEEQTAQRVRDLYAELLAERESAAGV